MKRRPRTPAERIVDRGFLLRLTLAGVLGATVSFGVFFHGLRTGSVEAARSLAFTSLVFIELLKAFSFRSETKAVWQIPLYHRKRNRFIDVMRHCISLNGSFFNTQRMVQQYVVKAYLE